MERKTVSVGAHAQWLCCSLKFNFTHKDWKPVSQVMEDEDASKERMKIALVTFLLP